METSGGRSRCQSTVKSPPAACSIPLARTAKCISFPPLAEAESERQKARAKAAVSPWIAVSQGFVALLQHTRTWVQYGCWPGFAPLFPVGYGPGGAICLALIFFQNNSRPPHPSNFLFKPSALAGSRIPRLIVGNGPPI